MEAQLSGSWQEGPGIPGTALQDDDGSTSAGDNQEANRNKGRWRSIRPWRPPSSVDVPSDGTLRPDPRRTLTDEVDSGRMSLEVLDVSSTAVALSVSGGPSPDREALEVKLDASPWPHVTLSSDDVEEGNLTETLVIYGLEPGRDYEVELGLVSAVEEVQADEPSPTSQQPLPSPTIVPPAVAAESEPPPPYSSHDPTSTESSLKATLKAQRAAAKAAEASLQASCASIRKALEKSSKEDFKQKQRLQSLEDTIVRLRDQRLEEIECERVERHALSEDEAEQSRFETELAGLRKKVAETEARVSKLEAEEKDWRQAHEAALADAKAREMRARAETARLDSNLTDLQAKLARLDAEMSEDDFASTPVEGVLGQRRKSDVSQTRAAAKTRGVTCKSGSNPPPFAGSTTWAQAVGSSGSAK